MLKMAERGRDMSFRYYMIAMATIVLYLFITLMQFHQNLQQPVDQRKLIYHFAYPYNSRRSPNYEITYFIQILAGSYAAFINATVGSFISMLLLHISAQLINIRLLLNKLVKKLAKKSISSSTFMKDLTAIIVRHENLIRYVSEILTHTCFNIIRDLITRTFKEC